MCGRSFFALGVAVCVLSAPSAAMAADPNSPVRGDYEPGGLAPAFTPGSDQGVSFPQVPLTELPFTGIPIFLVVLIGMILLSIGTLLRRLGSREP
jgi:hypothetical protein